MNTLTCLVMGLILFGLMGCTPQSKDRLNIEYDPGEEYFVQGTNGEAVLLLHGFDGMPLQMRELAQVAEGLGYTVHTPRLPGHCGHSDLAKVAVTDWYDKVQRAFDELQATHDRVHYVGFSIGGTLGLRLASRHQVASLVVIAPALHLVSKYLPIRAAAKAAGILGVWSFSIRRPGHVTVDGRTIPIRTHYSGVVPFSAVAEAVKLADDVAPCLGQVRCPALVITPRFDLVVSRRSARDIFARIGSDDKRYVELNCFDHDVIVHSARKQINKELRAFLLRQHTRD